MICSEFFPVVGQQVSHYEIVARIGSGGMGEVYEARDHRLGRRVALKFLPGDLSGDPRASERLQREARIASSLNHPHICTIHDVDVHDGVHFIVMELLEGVPLTERIRSRPINVRELVEIALQVSDALAAAHKLGIVHRDIKPANIFLTRRGEVKVLDFGVAKLGPMRPPTLTSRPTLQHGDAVEQHAQRDTLTTGGVALGTIQYMSPEQARGEAIDARSDVFSLGAVMYEMATGRPAFAGMTPAVIWDGILNRHPPRASLITSIPAALDPIIERAMEKDLAERYQSATALMADLRHLYRTLSGEVQMGRTAEFPTRFVPKNLLDTSRALIRPSAASKATPTQPARRRSPRLAVVAATALAIVGAGAYWKAQQGATLVERDLIVVADFTNTTGDSIFDGALREAVDVQLRQSRWFRVLGEQRTISTLRLMGQASDTPVTGAIARDLCQRAGGDAVVEGKIGTIGSTYVITLDAQQCVTGDSLAKEQIRASTKDAVLERLGTATSRLRKRLGESLQSLERFDTPIQEATTPSLSALRAYSLGVRARVRGGDSAALPFFRQALDIDPRFALAHARLGVVYENLGDRPLARDEVQKAYDLRDKVSEYERLYIVSRYYDIVTGDLEKRIETLKLLGDTFPRDFAARNNLGVAYLEMGRLDQALEEFRTAVTVAPDQRLPSMNLATTLVMMGRLDEAKTAFDRTLSIGDSSDTRAGAFMRAFFAGDRDDMDRQFEAGRKGGEPWLLSYSRAMTLAYGGHIAEARRFISQGISAAVDANRPGAVARGWLQLAFYLLQVGDLPAARDAAARALQSDRDARSVLQVAAVVALAGDPRAAEDLIASREDPQLDTITRDVFLAEARAAVAIAGGRAQAAQTLLDGSYSYQARYPELIWIRGLAHLRTRDSAAIDDFRTLVANPWRGGAIIYPATGLYLARAYAQAGDSANARLEYERFLKAWESADADLALVVDARKQLRSLTSN